MPSIQLARLNAEVHYLVRQFDQPGLFISTLCELFDRYADRSFRQGDVTRRNIRISQYHLPGIVLQKVLLALRPKCQADPQAALGIAETLHKGEFLELRLIAYAMLNLLPLDTLDESMTTVHRWAVDENEAVLHTELFRTGCAQLRVRHPQVWLHQIDAWLQSEDRKLQGIGLRAVLVSIEDADFRHLPNIYRLCTDLLMEAPYELTGLLQDLVEGLIRRSPAETSFFLKQILLRGASKETQRIIRRKLSLLPKEYQALMRSLLSDLQAQGASDETGSY